MLADWTIFNCNPRCNTCGHLVLHVIDMMYVHPHFDLIRQKDLVCGGVDQPDIYFNQIITNAESYPPTQNQDERG